MTTSHWKMAIAAAVAVAIPATLAVPATSGAATAPAESSVSTSLLRVDTVKQAGALQTAAKRGNRYSPRPGVKFNHPLRPKMSHRINKHIRLSILSTRAGQRIRIFSWNINSAVHSRALIAAHKRGVSVRILMSNGLAEGQGAQGDYRQLRSALSKGQRKRTAAQKSWVRTCRSSCRGAKGIAHAKFYTFSKAGASRNVVMVSSANLTEAAARNQWNSVFTVVGRQKVYDQYQKVFAQASRDRRATPPYRTFKDGNLEGYFLPYNGPQAKGDPVVRLLSRVLCTGTTGTAGINGNTAIRIGQTAFLNERGIKIARKINSLYQQGCNIKVIYAVMGGAAGKELWAGGPRGRVPSRHIVQDFDADGDYDRYLHMKDLTISGVFDNQTDARVVYTGTQNFTEVSINSDEAGFLVRDAGLERTYANWINNVFANPPPYRGSARTASGAAPLETYTPATAHKYANVELD
ncbi:phospholipase D-like domain-containing protein [Nocardioides pacificus]